MQEEGKAYRLAGICKNCHEFRFGFLRFGVVGAFICYLCAQPQAKPSGPPPAPSDNGGINFFTFTISGNDSTATWKQGSG